jgi:endonuclease/exonuclease/phosphatase family metal-dependent hydrolase
MQGYFANSNVRSHVCFLSRHPVRQWHSHLTFPPLLHNAIEAEIEFRPGRILRLIGVHPVAFLGWPFEVWRMWEARHIVSLVDRLGEPCIITGDFNAIAPQDRVVTSTMPRWLRLMLLAQGNHPYHFAMSQYLNAGLTDCFRFLNPSDDGFTLPPPTPNSRLDYILVNDALKPFLKKCWVVREPEAVLKASDHYPVVAEFDM